MKAVVIALSLAVGAGSEMAAGQELSLTTQVPPSSGLAGPEGSIFLEITSPAQVAIVAFDYFAGFPGQVTVDIYSKSGTYVGFTGAPGAWTHLVTIKTTAASFTSPVRLNLPTPVWTTPSQTVAFYIVGTINGVGYNGSNSNPPQTVFANQEISLFSDTARGATFSGAVFSPRAFSGTVYYMLGELLCYPNCDESTVAPMLNVADFGCFLQKFAAGDPYANCDGSTVPPVLNVADFTCFLTRFAAGCR